MFAWLPYVAADAGSLMGGWMSGHLIGRGWTEDKARKLVIAAAAILMSAGILAAFAQTAAAALGFIAIVLFGFQSWINNVQTLPSDYFPEHAVGFLLIKTHCNRLQLHSGRLERYNQYGKQAQQ